ncbi:unnamed protein product [Schistocephalus solidus]|uniref:RNA-binding protein 25-like n=1 Tax=Schistocephalus solidus TaxID=70667 RepID=A0A183T8X5_SCHSO|nr:unnamed protein product [Schistocephalus solidus]
MKLEKERQDREQGLRKLAEKLRQREADRRRAERLLDVGRRRRGAGGGLSPGSPSRSVGGASTASRSCSPRSPPAPSQPPRRDMNKRPSPSFDRVRGYDRERFADDRRSPTSSFYRSSDYTRCRRGWITVFFFFFFFFFTSCSSTRSASSLSCSFSHPHPSTSVPFPNTSPYLLLPRSPFHPLFCFPVYDDRRPNGGRGYYGRSDRYGADYAGRAPSPRRYERSRDRR